MKKIKTKDMILIAMFAALTAIGAFIRIPTPIVPLTLQVLFCAYSGILLGAKHGLYSQLLYLFIGLIGIPIFSNGGGPSYVLQPTFGYLVGFAFCSYIIGRLTENLREYRFHIMLGAILIGLVAVYIFGLTHFYIIMNVYLNKTMSIPAVITAGLVPFIPTDLISAIVVAGSCVYILPVLKRSGVLL